MHRGPKLPLVIAASTIIGLISAPWFTLANASSLLTPEAINNASLEVIPTSYPSPAAQVDPLTTSSIFPVQAATLGNFKASAAPDTPSVSVARLQILLDRAGASPGVIDGFDGGNVRSALAAFQAMRGLSIDGKIGAEVIEALQTSEQVIGAYIVNADDLSGVVGEISRDYAAMAEIAYLGYARASEALAERFHMHEELLKALNPNAAFAEGETIFVADRGADRQGVAVRLEVDKAEGQLRAYADDGSLLAAYPATIGSESNPSPSGVHTVKTVVENPSYTYNPKLNFKQGDNDKVLTLSPGPNGPVGTMWIGLSEPSFGIHGTPEPAKIDKTGSHGCVRLTNWDAQELGKLVTAGVSVEFL